MSSSPPLTVPSPPIREDIALQRATVARLKKDILGVDRNARKRYIRDFHEEFDRLQAPSSFDDLVVACYKADIVYIGTTTRYLLRRNSRPASCGRSPSARERWCCAWRWCIRAARGSSIVSWRGRSAKPSS